MVVFNYVYGQRFNNMKLCPNDDGEAKNWSDRIMPLNIVGGRVDQDGCGDRYHPSRANVVVIRDYRDNYRGWPRRGGTPVDILRKFTGTYTVYNSSHGGCRFFFHGVYGIVRRRGHRDDQKSSLRYIGCNHKSNGLQVCFKVANNRLVGNIHRDVTPECR